MRADSMAIEQAAAGWLARRDGGRWNAEEEAALQRWLDVDVGHRVAFLRLEAAWQEGGRLQALGAGWQDSAAPARGHWQVSPAPKIVQEPYNRKCRQPLNRHWVARYLAQPQNQSKRSHHRLR